MLVSGWSASYSFVPFGRASGSISLSRCRWSSSDCPASGWHTGPQIKWIWNTLLSIYGIKISRGFILNVFLMCKVKTDRRTKWSWKGFLYKTASQELIAFVKFYVLKCLKEIKIPVYRLWPRPPFWWPPTGSWWNRTLSLYPTVHYNYIRLVATLWELVKSYTISVPHCPL